MGVRYPSMYTVTQVVRDMDATLCFETWVSCVPFDCNEAEDQPVDSARGLVADGVGTKESWAGDTLLDTSCRDCVLFSAWGMKASK